MSLSAIRTGARLGVVARQMRVQRTFAVTANMKDPGFDAAKSDKFKGKGLFYLSNPNLMRERPYELQVGFWNFNYAPYSRPTLEDGIFSFKYSNNAYKAAYDKYYIHAGTYLGDMLTISDRFPFLGVVHLKYVCGVLLLLVVVLLLWHINNLTVLTNREKFGFIWFPAFRDIFGFMGIRSNHIFARSPCYDGYFFILTGHASPADLAAQKEDATQLYRTVTGDYSDLKHFIAHKDHTK
jgi:hypothetical protein